MKKFEITEILGFIFWISIVIFFIFAIITHTIPTMDGREKFCADEVSMISSSYDLDEDTSSEILRIAHEYLVLSKGKKFVDAGNCYFDIDTGVFYSYGYGISGKGRVPLYNPDGSLSTYEHYEIFLEVLQSLKESGFYG